MLIDKQEPTRSSNEYKKKYLFTLDGLLKYLPLTLTMLYIPVFNIVQSINKYAIISYGDSNSHSVIARSVFDSLEPFSLGTTWLPLYHLILAPFCIPDIVFFNYLSGFILNLIMVFIALTFLRKLLTELHLERATILSALVLFALNPDYIYLSLTPMTETTFIATCIVAAYYFSVFVKQKDASSVLAVSFAIIPATLIRYESWFFAPLPLLFTLYEMFRSKKTFQQSKALVFRSMISMSGIAFWILYNRIAYGSALGFLGSTKSAGYAPASAHLRLNFPAVGNAFLSNFFPMYGAVITLLVLVYFIFTIRRRQSFGGNTFILLFLFAPVAYLLVSLLFGYAQIKSHWNSRYLLAALPYVIVVSSIALNSFSNLVRSVTVSGAVIYYVFQATGTLPLVSYADAQNHIYERTFESSYLGAYIADSLKSERVLHIGGPANSAHRIMMFSRQSLKKYEVIRCEVSDSVPFVKNEIEATRAMQEHDAFLILEYRVAGYEGEDIPAIKALAEELEKKYRVLMKTEYFVVLIVR